MGFGKMRKYIKATFLSEDCLCCDPDRIRTCDPQLRRLLLYPAELPDQSLHFGVRHGLMSKVDAKVMLFLGFAINFIFYRIIVQVSV